MEHKIIVKGEAKTRYPNISELDGIKCDEDFAGWFDDKHSFMENIKDGYMKFVFHDDKLWTITTYTATRELTQNELAQLEEYTVGQWSDGIGEGFEQQPCFQSSILYQEYPGDDELTRDVYISPWYKGQVVTTLQINAHNYEVVDLAKTLFGAEEFLKKITKKDNGDQSGVQTI